MKMFGANIYLLIGLLLAAVVGLIALIAVWTALKIWLCRRAQRRSDEQRRREKFQPDGRPYPPSARGICQMCGRHANKIYHLPTGERLCAEDYETRREQRSA